MKILNFALEEGSVSSYETAIESSKTSTFYADLTICLKFSSATPVVIETHWNALIFLPSDKFTTARVASTDLALQYNLKPNFLYKSILN